LKPWRNSLEGIWIVSGAHVLLNTGAHEHFRTVFAKKRVEAFVSAKF
jgi:hypothetical protein